MEHYSRFIDFCILASFIHAVPDMSKRSRQIWSVVWTCMAVVAIGIMIYKGA